jgi:hypothetical protein
VSKLVATVAAAAAAATIGSIGVAAELRPESVAYLGQQIVETGYSFQWTAVGGLSSIDFDPATNRYLAISDDRSEKNPARFYELALDLRKFRRSSNPGRDGVRFTAVTTILDPQGLPYGPQRVDPEGLRLDAARQQIYWTNEGRRKSGDFQAPGVRRMNRDGSDAGAFAVPERYTPRGSASGREPNDRGVYDNLAFESLSLSRDGKTLWTATENALAQDDRPSTYDRASKARLLSFDIASRQPGAEYVYEVSPPSVRPLSEDAMNGLADFIAIGERQFITIERSFAKGAQTPGVSAVTGKPTGNSIRLFLADAREATDVSSLDSIDGRDIRLVKKQLLLDLSVLHNDDGSELALDNIEGITLGPLLEGKQTLILVSDNNFRCDQFTQFIALTIDALP